MGLPKTVRFDDELESKVEEYIEKNDIKFSQLIKSILQISIKSIRVTNYV